jgi:hypothetical protein
VEHHVDVLALEHPATPPGRLHGDREQSGDDDPLAVEVEGGEFGVGVGSDHIGEHLGLVLVGDERGQGVHSMDIASVVGAERLREIMAALVDRAAVVVQRYEGTVGEFAGDGIMAVLGGRP